MKVFHGPKYRARNSLGRWNFASWMMSKYW